MDDCVRMIHVGCSLCGQRADEMIGYRSGTMTRVKVPTVGAKLL